jgi:hypothetical protein
LIFAIKFPPPCPPKGPGPPCSPKRLIPPCPPKGGLILTGFKAPFRGFGGKKEELIHIAKRSFLYTVLTLQIFTFSEESLFSQTLNYPEIFGDDWKKAELFEKENRSWMEPVLARNHISYPLAVAVIFPELVRYSALRDKMEITLLKALYINLGDDYANFSIGQFQMKPSFAALVHQQANSVLNRRSGINFRTGSDYEDITDFRKSIVKDLEDPKTEFNYLVAFIKICEKNFRTNRMDEIPELKFLATAYNYGINKSSAEIEKMVDKKFFNTKLFKTENYSYADVSLFWYKQYKSANK